MISTPRHIDELKVAIAQGPSIKPILAQVALKAVALGQYDDDDDLFNPMPVLFPYNSLL